MLTIIVLTYNHETTIRATLDSILEQKTTYPYEILICEDRSTDRTSEICRDYAARYPDRIRLNAQPRNTGGKHLREGLCSVRTKYLSLLEGDDYWCDENKIQLALDFLEEHPEYTTFAHDTWFNEVASGTKRSLVHDILKAVPDNPIALDSAPYLHTSARIHRNVVDFSRFPKKLMVYDIYLFYFYLDKGPLHYSDRIMSVYNITGTGMWSKLSPRDQEKNKDISFFTINRLLAFKHDALLTSKISTRRPLMALKKLLGVRAGWIVYLLARYRTLTV